MLLQTHFLVLSPLVKISQRRCGNISIKCGTEDRSGIQSRHRVMVELRQCSKSFSNEWQTVADEPQHMLERLQSHSKMEGALIFSA